MTAAGTQSAESLESLESLEPRRFGFREGLPLWRDALRRRLLAAADVAGGVAALLLIGWFAGTRSLAWGLLVLPLCVLLAKLHGLYDRDHRALRHLTVDELPGIIAWSLSCIAVVALLATTGEIASLTAGQWIASWLALVLVAAVGRSLARAAWRHVTEPEATMLVGSGAVAQFMQRKLELFDDIHVQVDRHLPSCRHLELEDASDWCRGVDRVIVASDTVDEEALSKLIETCRKERIKLSMVPPPRRMFSAAVHLNHVADLPLIEYTTWTMSRSTLLLKRSLDLAVSLCMLVLTAPCLATDRIGDPARLARPGLLRPDARRRRRTTVPHGQVPHDDRRRRGAPRRSRGARQPRVADVQASARPARHARRPDPVAARASTSCRSSSTC